MSKEAISTERALKLALEALDVLLTEPIAHKAADRAEYLLLQAAPAIRKALAEQPAQPQEPLCYIATMALNDLQASIYHDVAVYGEDLEDTVAIYTSPPAQQEQVADKHQAFIDSLPSDMEDKMFEQIHYWARQSYARHQRSTRGQTITAADSSDNHIIWAALRWAKENAATPQAQPAQPAQQEPVACANGCRGFAKYPAQRTWVGLTEQEAAECWSTSTVRTWQAIEAKLKEKNT